jgi:tRNA (guanine37-N1)-methyltransferase
MLLMCEPVFNAIESVKKDDPDALVYLPTPAGKIWEQKDAQALADRAVAATDKPLHIIILCPHYEGYDERILTIVDQKFCLGKYVLTGGELPSLILIDSVVRLIPGVLGGENSAVIESFSDGDNIEYPQYTKPYDFRGMKVPDILLSGNHGAVDKWRKEHEKKF